LANDIHCFRINNNNNNKPCGGGEDEDANGDVRNTVFFYGSILIDCLFCLFTDEREEMVEFVCGVSQSDKLLSVFTYNYTY